MIVTALDTPTYYNVIASIAVTHGVIWDGMLTAAPCKPLSAGHANHPCALWARAHPDNLWYLVRLANALCTQKLTRWPSNPAHQYHRYLASLMHAFEQRGYSFHDKLPESFPIAIPKHSMAGKEMDLPNTVLAYRAYYASNKASFATWRRPAMTPMWFTLAVEALAAITANTVFTDTNASEAVEQA